MDTGSAPSKSKRYSAVKTRFFFADLVVTIAALAVFQLSASRAVSRAALEASGNFYLSCFIYAGIFLAFMYAATFPLHLANSFFVERHFGLSERKFSSWILDETKSAALSFALWMPCIQVFYLVLRNFPRGWWIIASCLWAFFSIVLSRFLPVLIIPLFYRYIPIKDEGLKKRIVDLARKSGISLMDVCQIDFSTKTKKANAALVGLGNTQKVILADTLMREFNVEEVESVVAHEFAHYKKKHIWQLLAFSALITLCGFFLLSVAAGKIAAMAGASGLDDLYLFPVLLLLMLAFGLVVMPGQNFFSRVLEKQADRFALDITGNAGSFISVMRKLAAMNLADTAPPLWKKIFFYNHPPISERIRMAEGEIKV